MNILNSLKENNSIQLKKTVNSWEEAIRLLMKPLKENGSIKEEYIEAIINRTNEIGPFYILAPGLAMPHERGEKGALKDAFTFLTLNEPVEFPTGEKVDILVGFSATDSEVHIAEAIPQVVALFEEDDYFDKIRSFNNNEELHIFIEEILK